MAVAYKDGQYNVEIIDVAFNEEDQKPPQIVLRVKVLQEYDATTGDYHPCLYQYDRTIYLQYMEEYKDILLAKLRGAGWEGDDFGQLRDQLLAKACFAVNRCRIAEKGKYAGQEVEGWDLYLPPRESKPLESKPQVARKLNALFGKVLKEGRQAESVPQPAGVGAPPDDDVPF